MRRPVVSLAALAFAGHAVALAADPVLPSFPSLSPDGSVVAFSWAGDLWVADAGGGVATRVTSHPADEGRSAFSPDSRTLAFESNRDGPRNLYTVELSGDGAALTAGPVSRVTEIDRFNTLSGFSPDGESLLLSGFLEPSVHRHARMYTAPLQGGPIERITDAFGNSPRPTADGGHLFHRGRDGSERPKYRGPASMDLFELEADGSFRQLTTHPANDFHGFGLPDGSTVFISSRDGQNNLYLLPPDSTDETPGALRALTSFSPGDEVSIGHGVRDLAVSADGSTAVFVVWDTVYALDLAAAAAGRRVRPEAVSFTASADDNVADDLVIDVSRQATEIAWHPSGEAVAVVARGEIWVRSTDEDRPVRRVTETPWRERGIAWSPDGERLYFSVDGEESLGSIHAATVTLTRDDLAGVESDDEDVLEAAEDDAEADDGAESEAGSAEDGGEEGAASEEETDDEGGEEDTGAAEEDDAAEPEVPENDHGERWAGSLRYAIEPVVTGPTWDTGPVPSPDGESLLFTRGLGDLMHLDLETGDERLVFKGWDAPEVLWMPDSRHIIYARSDLDFNSDIWLLDLEAGGVDAAINLTRHPDIDTSPRLSADGKVLVFLSDRAGENWNYDVHRVFLDRSLDDMTEYELAEYFSDAKKAAGKREPLPLKPEPAGDDLEVAETEEEASDDADALILDVNDAWLRIDRLTAIPGSEGNLALTPGGERLAFSAVVDGDSGLYSVGYDGDDRKRLVSGSVSRVGPSLTGSAFAHIRGGVAATVPPSGGSAESYPISAEVRLSRAVEQQQKFLEGARVFGATFYDIKGLDWDALTERYAELMTHARTSGEFNRLFTLMLGEVDGSHTGIRGGGGFTGAGPDTGYLAIDAEPEGDGYRVTRVLEKGPSAKGEAGLLEEDVIVSINGDAIIDGGIARDLRTALTGTVGAETLLGIRRDSEDAFVLVTPQSYGSETTMRYDDEVAARRAEVERLSGGRLGYLHIRGMNLPSVRDFERDLYAAANGREGLVIDVRDNGGGFTTDILLASLTAPRHAYTVPRGADPSAVEADDYPRDRRLIYGWTRPVNVLMNQYSFSNAEIFSHAIKTSGRGRLIGTQTFGGVISTGGFSLIDGTFIRRPFRGWYLPDGRDMDVHGAEPDVDVPQTPEDEATGTDRQLEAAVADLLDQIDSGKDTRAVGG